MRIRISKPGLGVVSSQLKDILNSLNEMEFVPGGEKEKIHRGQKYTSSTPQGRTEFEKKFLGAVKKGADILQNFFLEDEEIASSLYDVILPFMKLDQGTDYDIDEDSFKQTRGVLITSIEQAIKIIETELEKNKEPPRTKTERIRPEVGKQYSVQCVAFDIVGFTNNNSTPVQLGLVEDIRDMVAGLVRGNNYIYIPTGDGGIVTFLEASEPDRHLRLARQLKGERISGGYQFDLRISVNEGLGVIVSMNPLTTGLNIFGTAITYAARLLAIPNPNEIICAAGVAEKLWENPYYKDRFINKGEAIFKHASEPKIGYYLYNI
jgi:hypothetical protein